MRRGFTLMELLAVIVVLSVTALIVTPIIYGVIEDADKKSFEITCDEIYKSYDQYQINEETGKEELCSVFEFDKNREKTEIIDTVRYEPISKLNLKGEIPKKGLYRICNNERRLIIDNGKYTCVRDKKGSKILDGTIEDNDTTSPEIKDLILSSTTNSIKVIVNVDDTNGLIEKYYYKIGETEVVTNSNVKIFTNLEKNKEYKIEVIAENTNGLRSNTVSKTIKTLDIASPRFNETQTPVNSSYAISKKITIKYDIGTDFEYYFKSSVDAKVLPNTVTGICGYETMPGNCEKETVTLLEAGIWYKTENPNPSIIYNKNGYLYALNSDGTTNYNSSTYRIDKIDTSAPSVKIKVGSIKTDRVTLTAVCSDNESGIIRYEYSKDDGKTWITGVNSTYTFTGLNKETSYQYKVRCTNGSEISETASASATTLGMTNPVIRQISQTPTGYEWVTSRTIGITYNNTNIASPNYYFKSSVSATVASGVVTEVCGTGTVPGSCTTSSVTTLVANTWYKTNSINPSIVYVTNGVLYALISDGTNVSGTSTYTIDKIDPVKPAEPIITISDEIGSGIYHISDFIINLSGGNNISGNTYYYGTSNNPTTIYNPISITSETNGTEYYFKNCSGAGLCSNVISYNVKLDKSNPTIYPNVTPGNYNNDITVTFNAFDSISGIQLIQYEIYLNNNLVETNYNLRSSSFSKLLNDGNWSINVKALDNSNRWSNSNWSNYNYSIIKSYPATDSSYGAILVSTSYSATETENGPYTCFETESGCDSVPWNEAYSCTVFDSGSSMAGCWECVFRHDDCYSTELTCPNGGELNGNTCTKTEYTCPNGGTLNGTTCILYTCPDGGTLNGTTCIK